MSLTISANSDQLIHAIRHDKSIQFDQGEEWEIQPKRCCNLFHRIFGNPEFESISNSAKQMLTQFDALEKIPVPLKSRFAAHQKLPAYFRIADAIIAKLNHMALPKARILCGKLKQRVLSLKYRVGQDNGGLNKNDQIDLDIYQALKIEMANWKRNQIFFDDPEITFKDLNGIYELCHYGDYAKLILKDKNLKEAFFKWRLRDNNPINVFVEYAAVTETLEKTFLNKCVSRLGHVALKLQQQSTEDGADSVKVVTLPFEEIEISILNDEEAVTFKKGNWTVTLRHIFDELSKQNTQMPRFTFFPKIGIQNWKADGYSYWDYALNKECVVDLSKPNWYEQLPKMEIPREEAQKRFKDPLNHNQAVVALCATRSEKTLSPFHAHGYTEIALPSKVNTYYLYSFGNFARAEDWPSEEGIKKWPSLIAFAAKTVLGIVPYPDGNVHYTHRQFARLSFVFDPKIREVAENYLSSFRDEIAKSLQGNLTFQLGADNCAKKTQNRAEANLKGIVEVPNVFGLKFEDAKSPFQKFAKSVAVGKTRSDYIRRMQTYFRFLCPGRGMHVTEEGKKIWKSMDTLPFWKNWMVYQPTKLFAEQEMGKIPYVIHVK